MYITYPTALEYWMNAQCQRTLTFSSPQHVGVKTAAKRKPSKDYVYHVLPKHLPENSFVRISESLFVASPELCFLMAATEYSLPELVRLGNDLCGIYILEPQAEYGQTPRDTITDADHISSYLKQASGVRGIKKASMAIQYVCNRSGSPIESCLAAAAVLPLCHGGYGIEKPHLNHNINLTSYGARQLGRNKCCSDMVWIARKVVVEYDSNMTHLDVRQHYLDLKRANALTLSGYTLISIAADQLKNFQSIEKLFTVIMKALGLRIRRDRLNKYMEKRWAAVKAIFFRPAPWLKLS